MKKTCLVVALLFIVVLSQAQAVMTRMLPDFSSVHIDHTFCGNVCLQQSPESRLEIYVGSKDENIEYIVSKIEDGELILSVKDDEKQNFQMKMLSIVIFSPNFNAVTVEGVGNVEIQNKVKGENFMLDVRGVGNVHIGELQMSKNIVITAKTAGNFDIEKCKADDFVLQLGGPTQVEIGEISSLTSGNKVAIYAKNAGNVLLKSVSADKMLLKNECVGNMKISGNVANLEIYNESVGKLNITGLTADYANIINRSLDNIGLKVMQKAFVTEKSDIMGTVKIKGPAKVIKKVPMINKETGEEEGEMELLIK